MINQKKSLLILAGLTLTTGAAANPIEEFSIRTVNPAQAHHYSTGVAAQLEILDTTAEAEIDGEIIKNSSDASQASVIASYAISPRIFAGLKLDYSQSDLDLGETVLEANATMLSPYIGFNINDQWSLAYRLGAGQVDFESSVGTDDDTFLNHTVGIEFHDELYQAGFAIKVDTEDDETDEKLYTIHGRRALNDRLGLGAIVEYTDESAGSTLQGKVVGDLVLTPVISLEAALGYISDEADDEFIDDSRGYLAELGATFDLNERLSLGAKTGYELVTEENTEVDRSDVKLAIYTSYQF